MKRDPASETLIRLRNAMGMNQARFAVEVMKSGVTTIARWETSHPPRGQTLQKLSRVANNAKVFEVRDEFAELWATQLISAVLDYELQALKKVVS